jgi:FtsP/CotA-like multicopper oxidase with cupredoxin domain
MFRRLAILVAFAGGVLPALSGQSGEGRGTPAGATGSTRAYYIAADEVDWNYAPAEMDHMTGKPYDERAQLFVEQGPQRIGRVFKKAVYREYTDASFTTPKPREPNWEHLGIVGPVLRGEAGDTLKVVFKNNAHFPFSMHPHGVLYDQASDGVKGILPGETFTYTWILDPRSAPKAGEPSSKLWLYHSHANERRDLAAGLVGAIIVSAKGTVRDDGTPKDVDREFVAIFYTADEKPELVPDGEHCEIHQRSEKPREEHAIHVSRYRRRTLQYELCRVQHPRDDQWAYFWQRLGIPDEAGGKSPLVHRWHGDFSYCSLACQYSHAE